MLNISSKKTFSIIEFILDNPSFKQNEVQNSLNTSAGQVNKVISWLIKRKYIEKSEGKYHVIRPNRLVQLIALSTTLVKKKEYHLSITKKELLTIIKRNSGTLCLDSALSNGGEEVFCYYNNGISLILDKIPRGKTKLTFYDPELSIPESVMSSQIRTIIDYAILERSSEIEKLILEKWGTLQ